MSTRSSRASKAQNEKNAAILRELMKKPSNKKCADCKRNDPRWASWNLGIFICIRCSGVHRSMGTHISKVKSVDLDTWTPEQIENMKKWGNFKANKYWEAKLTSIDKFQEKNFERWIRTKYELKRFVSSDTIPDPSTLPSEDNDGHVVLLNNSLKNSVEPILNTEEAQGIFSKVDKSTTDELISTKPEKQPAKDTDNIFFQDVMGASSSSVKNNNDSLNSLLFTTNSNTNINSNNASSTTTSNNNVNKVDSLKSSIMSLYNKTSTNSNTFNNQINNSNQNINNNFNNFAFSTPQTNNNNTTSNFNNMLFSNTYQSQNINSMNNNSSMPFYNNNNNLMSQSNQNQINSLPKKSDPFDFVSISSFTKPSTGSNLNSNSNTNSMNNFNIKTNTNNNDEFSDFQTASATQTNNWANF